MSRSTPGPTGPSNPTPSSLMTLFTTNSSLPRSTLRVERAQSTLKSTSSLIKVDSNLLMRLSTGSTSLKADLSTPKSSQAITSNSTLTMESPRDGTKSGISMLPLTSQRLYRMPVFVLELTIKASIATQTTDLKLISKMIVTILPGTTVQ